MIKVVMPQGMAELLPFENDIIACFQRLAKRFPNDTSTIWLMNEWLSGRRKLWLVLEDGAFRAAALTCINVLQSCGRKEAVLLDLSGDGASDYADELNKALEAWAVSEGAHFAAVIGRRGWERILKPYGYLPQIVHFRKELPHGQQLDHQG